jgi:hypothetical protein
VTLGQILDKDLGMHEEAAWVAVSVTCYSSDLCLGVVFVKAGRTGA